MTEELVLNQFRDRSANLIGWEDAFTYDDPGFECIRLAVPSGLDRSWEAIALATANSSENIVAARACRL